MTTLQWHLGDRLQDTATPPAPRPSLPPGRERQPIDWTKLLLVAVVVFLLVRSLAGGRILPIPTPDDRVVIDERGSFALILTDDANQDAVNRDQAAAITSTAVTKAAMDAGFKFRNYDVSEDLSTTDPVWSTLKQNAKAPPSITVAVDGKLKSFGIESRQQAIRTIQEASNDGN